MLEPSATIAVYTRQKPRAKLWGWLVAAALITLLLLWHGAQQAARAMEAYGPTAAYAQGGPWFALAGLVVFSAAMAYVLLNRRQAIAQLTIGAQALSLQTPGQTPQNYPWKEIRGIAFGQEAYRLWLGSERLVNRASLELPAGAISLAGYVEAEDIPLAVQQIKEFLYPELIVDLRREFNQGQTLQFGALRLNRQALHLHGKPTAWPLIRSIEIQAGCLVIQTINNQRQQAPVWKIPNLEIALSLAALATESFSQN